MNNDDGPTELMGLAYFIILDVNVKAKLEVSISAFEFRNPVSLARVKDFIHNGFCFERKSLIFMRLTAHFAPAFQLQWPVAQQSTQKIDDDLFSLIKDSTG